ncbi:MAG: lytic transglycosylase domain-containing protein [Pseudomonadota bacterium]
MAFRVFFAAVFASLGLAWAADGSVLTPDDEKRYRQIFALQEDGKMSEADPLIEKIEDPVLLGYVFEQRYMHPTAYRSRYKELERWLSAYADHPDARRIYRLAMRRRPKGARPQRPVSRRWRTYDTVALHPDLQRDYDNAPSSRSRQIARIEGRIRYLLAKDRPTQSLNYLNDPRQFNLLSSRQTDRIRGWIAESYYVNGKLTEAEKLAELAANRSGSAAVMANWTAGLVNWRRGDIPSAYKYFSVVAEEPHQQTSLRAAGAFWAARAALAMGQAEDSLLYLDIAAAYPLTLYGQLALGQLGRASGIDWADLQLTEEERGELLDKSPRLLRAAALAQVGRMGDASLEIRYAHGELTADDDEDLLAFAASLDATSAEVHLAEAMGVRETGHQHLFAALYPLPDDLEPNGGFTIDPAILFGLIRQESKFMTNAESRVGAAGLMQLMPRTASYIARDRKLAISRTKASKKLFDAGYNMQLGQSYVEMLLTEYNKGSGDLFEMALSYNWGPGNFSRWKARSGIEDQLLMLESVPNKEARHFVDLVMTNIWVYRDRLGQGAPARDAAASGARPIYTSVD